MLITGIHKEQSMNATLSLHDSRMAAEDLQGLTTKLLRSIHQETELTAELPEEQGGSGAKGDTVTTGQLLLVALSSGTVVTLLQVLKSYVERQPSLKMNIEAPDGRKLTIEAAHFSAGQIEQLTQAAKQFCIE